MSLDGLPDDSDRCWHCGARLPDDHRWGLRRYCNPTCRREYHNARKRALRREERAGRSCIVCGGAIPAERAYHALTCGKRCLDRLRLDSVLYRKRQQKRGRTCRHCGGSIPEARTLRAIYCNSKCADKFRRNIHQH